MRRARVLAVAVALVALMPLTAVVAPATAEVDRPAHRAARLDLTHVVRTNFPDPGFLVDRTGASPRYHLYATGGRFASRTATSPRGPFTDTGEVLAPRDPGTSWERATGHRWAPHVFRTSGRYVLWYTGTPKSGVTTTGSGAKRYHDCIGAAVSTTPVPVSGDPSTLFQPSGRPIVCASRNQTLIDGSHYAQGGRHFLVYKRRTYSPEAYDILGLEVTADGLSRKPGARPFRIVGSPDGRIIEAPSLVKRGRTLWLFTSRRNYATCDYRTEVFRSTRLSGGWRSAGVMNLRPSVPSATFCGPGGAEVVNDDGTYRIAFHAYDDSATTEDRTVWTGALAWGSGRPRVRTR